MKKKIIQSRKLIMVLQLIFNLFIRNFVIKKLKYLIIVYSIVRIHYYKMSNTKSHHFGHHTASTRCYKCGGTNHIMKNCRIKYCVVIYSKIIIEKSLVPLDKWKWGYKLSNVNFN